jgi:hypothetical protein
MKECPLGGDNKDCKSCSYYPDYYWDNDVEDCVRNDEL